MIEPAVVALLLCITFGTYFQTVTGFGVGMIVMGAASGFDLAPLPLVAAVVSLMALVNSAVALHGKLDLIDWPAARAVLLGVVPAIVAGVLMLDYLSASAADILKLILGAVIAFSGVMFSLRPTPRETRSSNRSFFASGVAAGLFGGMFGMSGPPVIFHFYRQPMAPATVRAMLLLIFAFTSASRTVFVGLTGGLTRDVWLLSALAVVLVTLATIAGRRYPPPINPRAMRRLAFSFLILIGLGLMASAANALF
jgi:uncharacterized membrane protein YfcA